MGELFRGWRRKVGVLTLLMALLFMGGWIRSYDANDIIQFRVSKKSTYFFVSNRSWLYWQCVRESYPYQMTSPLTATGIPSLRIPFTRFYFAKGANKFDHFDGLSTETFNVLMGGQKWFFKGMRFDVWGVPYWSITIPLTAVSAFLLLTKPKSSTPNKNAKPIPSEGGATS